MGEEGCLTSSLSQNAGLNGSFHSTLNGNVCRFSELMRKIGKRWLVASRLIQFSECNRGLVIILTLINNYVITNTCHFRESDAKSHLNILKTTVMQNKNATF